MYYDYIYVLLGLIYVCIDNYDYIYVLLGLTICMSLGIMTIYMYYWV